MYRLKGPKFYLFFPILVIGIIFVAMSPRYFGAGRLLSLSAFILGEVGLSFIPALALYPKASPIQASILAGIYLLTVMITCVLAGATSHLGSAGKIAFMIKDGEFYINTFALFAANAFSLINLVLNFRLIYDEELAKQYRAKAKNREQPINRGNVSGFQKTFSTPPKPASINREKSSSKIFPEEALSEDILSEKNWKPFEFEPDTSSIDPVNLPEESKGALFSSNVKEEKNEESEFFASEKNAAETTEKHIERPKPIKLTTSKPGDIRTDLQEIFEQYSSLNAIKKLTASKKAKVDKFKTELKDDVKSKRQHTSQESPQISIKIEKTLEEDVREGSFRQITEEENIQELREKLKKEIEEEIKQKLIEQNAKAGKGDGFQKPEELKENIIKSIHDIKGELIESLKKELKKELIEANETTPKEPSISKDIEKKERNEEFKISEKELEKLKVNLAKISKTPKVIDGAYINKKGTLLSEAPSSIHNINDKLRLNMAGFLTSINNEISKTNQGNICHVILESEEGLLVLANSKENILAVCTNGTGPAYTGQILKALSELDFKN